MKIVSFVSLSICATALGFACGCGKPEQATPPQAEVKAPPAADKPALEAKADALPPAPAVSAAADKVAADVQAQAAVVQKAVDQSAATTPAPVDQSVATAQAQVDSSTAQNQTTLDKAKQLLADNKPADALKMLSDLAGKVKLTPNQQTMLDNLVQRAKALLQSSAATNAVNKATEALGGLLQKK